MTGIEEGREECGKAKEKDGKFCRVQRNVNQGLTSRGLHSIWAVGRTHKLIAMKDYIEFSTK